MKTKNLLFIVAALAAVSMGAKRVQCGVSNQQIIDYLHNCSHHHPYACCVVDIPGTCNSTATIENCGTATVFVQDGIIIQHTDAGGICGN